MFLTGVDVTDVSATAKFPLGSFCAVADSLTHSTGVWMYVQSDATGLTAGFAAAVTGGTGNTGFVGTMLTTANAAPGTGTGKQVGVPSITIAANNYGWMMVYGQLATRVLASAIAYTRLNTTATAGALDDDATVGARVIDGIVLRTTNGGVAALVNAVLNWPRVGVTL